MTKEEGWIALDKVKEEEDDIHNKEEEIMKVILKLLGEVCAEPHHPSPQAQYCDIYLQF